MPNRFVPVNPGTEFDQAMAVMNGNFAQLDSEAVTKTFKQPSGNAIIEGKLPYEGGYGFLFYDPNGVPSIVFGILPDGTMGLVIANEGVDVLSLF